MKYFLPLLFLCTTSCFGEQDSAALACNSGVVETYTGVVNGQSVSVDHCLALGWQSAPCDGGGELCQYVYGPTFPGSGGTNLLFGDFMYSIRVSGTESYDLSPWGGPDSWDELTLAQEGYAVNKAGASNRYGGNAREMIIACDHPDVDPICPFTWYRKSVTDVEGSLVVDVSGAFADFQNPSDVGTAPDDYNVYIDQIGSMRITVQ